MWQRIVHRITGPGRVDADFGGGVIPTDHPGDGDRHGRAPEPWLLFLASIGTCAASFVAAYCHEHGLPAEEIRIVQEQDFAEESDTIREFFLQIELPEGFREKHRQGVVEAAHACTVKRVIEAAPRFRIEAG